MIAVEGGVCRLNALSESGGRRLDVALSDLPPCKKRKRMPEGEKVLQKRTLERKRVLRKRMPEGEEVLRLRKKYIA